MVYKWNTIVLCDGRDSTEPSPVDVYAQREPGKVSRIIDGNARRVETQRKFIDSSGDDICWPCRELSI